VNDVLTEVRFWSIVAKNAKRTVLCSPDLESRCKGYVEAAGLGGIITVKASPGCPDDRLFVVDEEAMRASMNELLARPIRLRRDS
jgi:hypothetical protein